VLVSLRTTSPLNQSVRPLGRTTGDGTFSAAHVPPGNYLVEARAVPGSGVTEVGSIMLTSDGADISGLVIVTSNRIAISGRVMFAGERPLSESERSKLRVVATAVESDGAVTTLPNAPGDGTLNARGLFRIGNVTGRVLFRLASQVNGLFLKAVRINGIDVTDMPFEVSMGTVIDSLDVILIDRPTSLSGVAKDTHGALAKDYFVAVFPRTLKPGVLPLRFTRSIRADQKGHFMLRDLPPGEYLAVAVDWLEEGDEWDDRFQEAVKARCTLVQIADGQSTSVDLPLVQRAIDLQ
jgi:hypothetical protein